MTALLLAATTVFAADGNEVVSMMDDAMNAAKDQQITYKVLNLEPGKSEPKNMEFTTKVKGPKTITSFSAPADLKGTRVLVMSRSQMYIFMPAYNKVRRIASHVTQQGFMGTTYSHEDMSTSRFGDIYDAALTTEDDASWTVELTPKAGQETPYAKVEVQVDKTMKTPLVIKNYNDKGTHLKTETRKDYECREGMCLPGSMKMEDHTRNGAWTELIRTDWKLNTGLAESYFTVRTLQRGG